MSEQPEELDIWWGPIPGTPQEGFFDDDTPDANLLFAGGWFAGKTMTLTAKALKLSAINAPVQGFWLVPDWGHILETIVPILTDVDPDSGVSWFLRPDQFHYHQTRHLLTWAGGGAIQFLSAEQPHRIAGPQGAFLVVDEPGSIKHEAWRNAVARVRHPRAKLRQKCGAGTPEGLNYLMELFGDAERPESYKVYTMTTAQNTEGLRHNPHYIQSVKENITEAEAASYLEGKFGNLTGSLAYPVFDEATHWTTGVEVSQQVPLRLCFDFNVDPMTLGVCQIVSGLNGPELRVIDWISEFGGATVESCCRVFLKRYPSPWPHGAVIYGDATGKARHVKSLKSNYQIIKETLAGWRITEKVPMTNPPVADRINAVNRLLKNANGVTRFWIRKTDPARLSTTRLLVKSFQKTTKKVGTDDLEKKAGETHTHATDALGYLVAVEFPVKRVQPVATIHAERQSLMDWKAGR